MPINFGNELLISIQILWQIWTLLGRGSWQKTLPHVRTICDCICCNFLFFWMSDLNLWGTEINCKFFMSLQQQRCLLCYLHPLNSPVGAGCWNDVMGEHVSNKSTLTLYIYFLWNKNIWKSVHGVTSWGFLYNVTMQVNTFFQGEAIRACLLTDFCIK